ncbi:MAG: hypothetical protein WDZ81_00435 [Candidatus Saccharimonadales bacterium]
MSNTNTYNELAKKDSEQSKTIRRKLGALILTLAVSVGGIAAVEEYLGDSNHVEAVEDTETEKPIGIVITMGDFQRAGYEHVNTLWEVAGMLNPESKMNTQRIVGEIRDINDIDGNEITGLQKEDKLWLESKYADTIEKLEIILETKETEEGKPYLVVSQGK